MITACSDSLHRCSVNPRASVDVASKRIRSLPVSGIDPLPVPLPQIVQTVATWAKSKHAGIEIGQGDAAECVWTAASKYKAFFFFHASKNES
jgi:hypothetical protein